MENMGLLVAKMQSEIASLRAQVKDRELSIRNFKGDVEDHRRAIKDIEEERNKALAEVERLTQIVKLQGAALDVWKKAHPHEQSPGACGRELAKAEAVVRAAEVEHADHQKIRVVCTTCQLIAAFRGRA